MQQIYPCLVLDHDDTVVASTPAIHYPSFMRALKVLRPEIQWSLEEYMSYNFDPGFEPLCWDVLHFTKEEMAYQESCWRKTNAQNHPPMFAGMPELLQAYHQQGGQICVVSHSSEAVIAADYQRLVGFEPDLIYGWERGEGRRKPDPWPLAQILEKTGLAPSQLLMVDDMKPGWEMAKACGVPFCFAGWGNPVPKAHEFMKQNASYYCLEPRQLETLLKNGQSNGLFEIRQDL